MNARRTSPRPVMSLALPCRVNDGWPVARIIRLYIREVSLTTGLFLSLTTSSGTYTYRCDTRPTIALVSPPNAACTAEAAMMLQKTLSDASAGIDRMYHSEIPVRQCAISRIYPKR